MTLVENSYGGKWFRWKMALRKNVSRGKWFKKNVKKWHRWKIIFEPVAKIKVDFLYIVICTDYF